MKAFTPLVLPNGTAIKNRFVKAAMEENMSQGHQLPGAALENLYAAWARGGVGMIITGNVMIDKMAWFLFCVPQPSLFISKKAPQITIVGH
jgi:2,4-dienoyl-CoA reductase-like NADH-dependent reductase (Old Yellow Enzyme family)